MISMEQIKNDNYPKNVRPFISQPNDIAVSGRDQATGNKIGKWNGKKTDFFTPDHQTNVNKNCFLLGASRHHLSKMKSSES